MKAFALCALTGVLLAGCSKKETPQAEGSVSINLGDEKNSIEKSLDKAGKELKAGAKDAQRKMEDAADAAKAKAEELKAKATEDKNASVKVEVKK